MITLLLEDNDYSEKALSVYRELGAVYFLSKLKPAQKAEVFRKVSVLVVRLAYKIDELWLAKMPNLKIIVSNTTGLNHLDLEEIKKRGIKVISLKGQVEFLKKITATAEETLALMLALARKLPWAFDDVKRDNWDRDSWRGHQLSGKILGLLGCGRLGKIMARYGRALGMVIIGCDPNVSQKMMKKFGVKKVAMAELFKTADFLSVHVNLAVATIDLVKREYFKIMKPSAYLINTSRGEIIDEKALLEALKKKWIAGAALDVMKNEVGGRHLKGNPLVSYARKNKNLIIVPHLGGAAFEAMHITEEFAADLARKIIRKNFIKQAKNY